MKKIILAACALVFTTAIASAQMGDLRHDNNGMNSYNMMHKKKMMMKRHMMKRHMMKKHHMM